MAIEPVQQRRTASGLSFVDQLDIQHGPRDQIALYFLAAETFLDQRGIVLRRVDPMEMVQLNRQQSSESWWRQVPILDAEDNPPSEGKLVAFIGRDADGMDVTAMSVRQFILPGTLKEEMESLRMFFGVNAPIVQQSVKFEMHAPSAERISGNVAYMGGLWVHPKARGKNLSLVVPRIARYTSLGLWGCDYDLSLTTAPFYTKQKVVDRYDFESIEPHYTYKQNGKLKWEGSLVWSSRAQLERNLPLHITEARSATSVGDGSR